MSDNAGGTTTTTETPSWYAGLDTEHVAHVQTKGWDKLDVAAAALEAVKAHRSAEKFVGVPADQVLRLPKAEDTDAWGAVWKRLGAPEKPEGYDFTPVEFDDAALTTRFRDAFRETAAKLNMPKNMAEEFAKSVHKMIEDYGQSQTAEQTAMLAAEKAKLVESWGPEDGNRFKANAFIADRAAERLGVDAATMEKLREGMGTAAVAQLFNTIGKGLGEDRFVADPGQGGRDTMTQEQASSRIVELLGDGRPGTGDVKFQERYRTGDTAARREIRDLERIKLGV
jgi:hypothetical protein